MADCRKMYSAYKANYLGTLSFILLMQADSVALRPDFAQ